MIPKVIHYCWFGGSPLPKSAIKCINSWKMFFPEYEIKEWNESNFDVNMMAYTREAYESKKYAFVSDVARFWILYHEGGLYFDTDVEVIRTFDDIVERGAFMGMETAKDGVNPGLGLGAEKNNGLIYKILEYYKNLHFVDNDGIPFSGTIVARTTEVLDKHGLIHENIIQNIENVTIYPSDYFNPFDDLTGVLKMTERTRSIHWYSKTWIEKPMWYFWITRLIHRVFGVEVLLKLKFV